MLMLGIVLISPIIFLLLYKKSKYAKKEYIIFLFTFGISFIIFSFIPNTTLIYSINGLTFTVMGIWVIYSKRKNTKDSITLNEYIWFVIAISSFLRAFNLY